MTSFKRGHGSCSFKCCDEEGISPGSPYIQMRPAEIPFSIQLLRIQEPCPPFQMVSLRHAALDSQCWIQSPGLATGGQARYDRGSSSMVQARLPHNSHNPTHLERTRLGKGKSILIYEEQVGRKEWISGKREQRENVCK